MKNKWRGLQLNKNKGCLYCLLNCKDKSSNAYFYCPKFAENKTKKKSSYDYPEGFDMLFKGFKGG